MKKQDPDKIVIPTHDYEEARRRAVSWLGDRYLLAEPARRTPQPATYFGAAPGWHVRPRASIATRH